MQTTYAQAQWMTEGAKRMILEQLLPKAGPEGHRQEDIECAAKYMRDSLKVGGLKACRALIAQAIAA